MPGKLLRSGRGAELSEEDCYVLYDHCGAGRNRLTAAATAALPDLLRLAAPPGGVRVDLVDLIGTLARQAATAPPEAVDPGRPAEWQHHRVEAETRGSRRSPPCCTAVLDDETLRAVIDGLPAQAVVGVAGTAVRAEDEVRASGTKRKEQPDPDPDQRPDQG